jgi:hypothetical protein
MVYLRANDNTNTLRVDYNYVLKLREKNVEFKLIKKNQEDENISPAVISLQNKLYQYIRPEHENNISIKYLDKRTYVVDGVYVSEFLEDSEDFIKYDKALKKFLLSEPSMIYDKEPVGYIIRLSNKISLLIGRTIESIDIYEKDNLMIDIILGDKVNRKYKHFCLTKTLKSFKVGIHKRNKYISLYVY